MCLDFFCILFAHVEHSSAEHALAGSCSMPGFGWRRCLAASIALNLALPFLARMLQAAPAFQQQQHQYAYGIHLLGSIYFNIPACALVYNCAYVKAPKPHREWCH